ncbi:MAG: HNH/endonuclease VII fold putative polymorphic toxin [Polyangiaceae bacterium]
MPGGVEHVVIRDDSAGHRYRDNRRQNRGPHYNNPAGGHFQYPGGAAPPGNTVLQSSTGMRYFVDRLGQTYSMDGRDVIRPATIRDVPQDVRNRIGTRAIQRLMRNGRIRMPPRGVE